MKNYLQHIIKRSLCLRSPKPVEAFSENEGFIKYTREVMDT